MLPFMPMLNMSSGMPAGAIIAFAGEIGTPVSQSSPPDTQDYTTDPVPGNPVTENIEGWGWMVCDGRSLYCYAYPQLFRTIGFLYSRAGDPYPAGFQGPLPRDAEFRIPDYRGYFLRAVNGNATGPGPSPGSTVPNDPDVAKRRLSDGMTTNAGVGSIQQDALQDHWHVYSDAVATAATIEEAGSVTTATTGTANTSEPTNIISSPPAGDTNTVRTSTETRAKNISVHYLIKYV